MVEAKKPGAAGAGRSSAKKNPAETLKALLDGYMKTASLQNEYQTLHQSLPNVLTLAGEILKKKHESEQAFDQGLVVVERVLNDASEKADALSKAMATQHETLKSLLNDKGLLTEVLKTGKAAAAASAFGTAGQAEAGPASMPIGNLGGGLSGARAGLDQNQLANQLNAVMGNIRNMIAQEVQKQADLFKTQPGQGGERPN